MNFTNYTYSKSNQKNLIFCDMTPVDVSFSQQFELSGTYNYFCEYSKFFLKEIIYELFPTIFYKKVIETLGYNLYVFDFIQHKNLFNAYFSLSNYFHTASKNFFLSSIFSSDEKFEFEFAENRLFRPFLVNIIRAQIVRENAISISISFMDIRILQKSVNIKKESGVNGNLYFDFLFKRINYTEKNRNTRVILVKTGTFVLIFNLKIKRNLDFKIWLENNLVIHLVSGQKEIQLFFFLCHKEKTICELTNLDNFYQVFPFFSFFKNANNILSFNRIFKTLSLNYDSDSLFRFSFLISMFDIEIYSKIYGSLFFIFFLKKFKIEKTFFLKTLNFNLKIFKKIWLLNKCYPLKKKKPKIYYHCIYIFVFFFFTLCYG